MPIKPKPRGPLEFRFWLKVEKTNECWKWHGAKHPFGYGMIQRGFKPHKKITAHRASWEIHFGVIPYGMNVLHKCDNPECTNPDHLFVGTFKDNSRDMYHKGRGWLAKSRIKEL